MDDDTRRLLGTPTLAQLGQAFLEAMGSHPDGLSPRQMHRRRPDVPVEEWSRAAMLLHMQHKVSHAWRPLKQPDSAIQESVFTKRIA